MIDRLSLYFAFVTLVFSARAGQTNWQSSDLFVSGTDGYHTYRIPALVRTTNGTLLAFCEGRKYSRSDTGKIDLILKRSTDGGTSWSQQQVVWSDSTNVCGNPCPVLDEQTGEVWLLLTWNLGSDTEAMISRGMSRDTRRVFVTHSTNDGLTWAKPRDITSEVKPSGWEWYATGPVNGIQMQRGAHRGRLVVPANHSELDGQGKPISRSHIIYSDDHGATWKLGGSEAELTNESTVAELSDGQLLHNMRSYHKKNRRAVATSADGGMSWSPLRFDDALLEPVCQGCLLRCTWPSAGEKSRILFSNPASTKRENLTIRVSYDEGASWPGQQVIFPGPSAYSCLCVLPDKTILCAFECGQKEAYEKIAVARLPLDSLEAND
jgi:sialidase-1